MLWANLHGLYFVGIGVVGAYALFTLLGRRPSRPYRWWAVAAVALAFAGAMVTPAGPLGVLYPLRYSQEWGLAHIQEWQSPDFHEAAHWPLLVLVIGLMLNGGRATPGWLQTVAYVGVVMALVALRNVRWPRCWRRRRSPSAWNTGCGLGGESAAQPPARQHWATGCWRARLPFSWSPHHG